jgi:membrane-associated phospholipid phosphatase
VTSALLRFGKRRTDRLLLALAAICLILGWTFAQVGSLVTSGGLVELDGAVRRFAQEHQSPVASAFFAFISALGSKPILILLCVVLAWWLSEGSKMLVIVLAVVAFVSAEFVDYVKEGFSVARPPSSIFTSSSYAFPSGHVSLVSYVSWRRRKAVRWVIPIGVLVVLLMAVSRIYLDRHWASDTLGGFLIGVALGLAFSALYEWTTLRHLDHE